MGAYFRTASPHGFICVFGGSGVVLKDRYRRKARGSGRQLWTSGEFEAEIFVVLAVLADLVTLCLKITPICASFDLVGPLKPYRGPNDPLWDKPQL